MEVADQAEPASAELVGWRKRWADFRSVAGFGEFLPENPSDRPNPFESRHAARENPQCSRVPRHNAGAGEPPGATRDAPRGAGEQNSPGHVQALARQLTS
jgi:hypothetical protein